MEKRSLVIKTRGGGISHIIVLAKYPSAAEEWNMIQLATSHIPCVVSYDEKCKIQKELREKDISIFGDYILELIPTTLM